MTDQSLRELEFVDLKKGMPLSEAVYRSLCQALHEGRYRSGDRLREEEIAKQLKVSRTPVREALGRLLAKGFVEPAGGRGLVVRSLDTAEVFELYAMREILEGAAARLAAQHASQSEIDALIDLENAFEARVNDPVEMARLNGAFHGTIFRSARNRYLDSALKELQDGIALLGATTFSIAERASTAAAEHRALVDAITARDVDRAENAARLHIREFLRSRLKLLHER